MVVKKIFALSIGMILLAYGVYATENPIVVIETSMGDIEAELFKDKAPVTVKNFLNYAEKDFYDNTVFHRVIDNFMIQGGGMTADLKPKDTQEPIKNEADNGVSNERGTMAMARTSAINSATSQFFINVKDNTFLDHKGSSPRDYGYAVFGKVISGMNVVDKIKSVKTTTKGVYRDVPVETIIIKDIRQKNKSVKTEENEE